MQCIIMEKPSNQFNNHHETKKRAHDSQIVRAKENLKLSHGGSSYRYVVSPKHVLVCDLLLWYLLVNPFVLYLWCTTVGKTSDIFVVGSVICSVLFLAMVCSIVFCVIFSLTIF